MSGFKEKRSVCLWNRGVNREFNRDEEGMVEAEWEEEYKKKPKTSGAVCLSQQQSEKLIREKKRCGWENTPQREETDVGTVNERRDSERAREGKKERERDKRMK